MSLSDKVRTTRDGDQFHYLWAARRCLRLLDPTSDLRAVTIEGVSKHEGHTEKTSAAGEEVVDVAEYYGSEKLVDATAVDYLQLKHTTLRSDQDWTASGLAKTLRGFAKKHRALLTAYGDAWVDARVNYWFVTNRPVSARVIQSAREIGDGQHLSHPTVASELKRHTKLPEKLQSGFFRKLMFADSAAKFTDQSNLLAIEASGFLVGEDLDAALRLQAFVGDKATTKGANNPSITRADVLQTLRIGPDDLFPARSELQADPEAVPRLQEAEIAAAITVAKTPVIISAPGGVGKSVLATRLPDLLPQGSVAIVFDCFANGDYRRPTKLRHMPRQALIQIVSELSARGLCLPLLPTTGADAQAYLRGFVNRLTQASFAVRADHSDAVLAVIVDAADNAVMAADEFATGPAFVRALLREPMPTGVRLAMLCRPERRHMLDPPADVEDLTLSGFDVSETAALLRRSYPKATNAEVDEFHKLSSQNPRVQTNALSTEADLAATLRSLGPNPTSVDDTIGDQLRRGIAKLREEAGKQSGNVDTLCVAMAALRPLIPLRVLSDVTGLRIEALHSFASDFGRGRWLMVAGDAIQFRDEPVEHWFRKTYTATQDQLRAFVARLAPLADTFPYVAATLPSLMLECGQLAELVELALSAGSLPTDSPLERREIELERLRFALRASLKSKRWLDAARLAAKAGQEAAGQARHETLLEDNTDLVGALLDADSLQEIAARRRFSGEWLGARYSREAVLLSRAAELRGDALNRLKIANDLLDGWSRLSPEARQEQDVSDEDRAELMLATLNLHGAQAATHELLRWSPSQLWFEAGVIVSRRLVDHGRFEDLDAIAHAAAARKASSLIAALTLALSEVGRSPPKPAVDLALSLPRPKKSANPHVDDWTADVGLLTVTTLVEAGLRHGYSDHKRLIRLLVQALPKSPPRSLGAAYSSNRSVYLRAAALLAALRGRDLDLLEVATDELRKALKADHYSHTQETEDFKTRVGVALPWWRLRAKTLLSLGAVKLDEAIIAAEAESEKAHGSYRDERSIQDEVAICRFDLLISTPTATAADMDAFDNWVARQKRSMFTPTWTSLARKAARHARYSDRAHGYAQNAISEEAESPTDQADTRIEVLVSAARALLALDRDEADLLFECAVDVASRLGDEVYPRWEAIVTLAQRAASAGRPNPEMTYRLSRCAELTSGYVEKHFDWHGTIDGMVGLGPSAAIAAVSRWRDRETGWFRDNHVSLWESLQKHGVVDPRLAIALLGYRFDWSTPDVLRHALESARDDEEKYRLLDMTVRGARLDEESQETWAKIVEVAQGHGLTSSAMLRGLVEAQHRQKQDRKCTTASHSPRRRKVNWDQAVANPLPTLAAALTLKKSIRGFEFENRPFWRAAFGQIPAQSAATLVHDALGPQGLNAYELKDFFAEFPAAWRKRLTVKRALTEGMKAYLTRECWALSKPRRWAPLTVPRAAEWSGLPEEEVVTVALAAIAADPKPAGSTELFNLVALLAQQLNVEEARTALGHSLSLIEAALPEDFGEGPWTSALTPRGDVSKALAGMIWGTLGSVLRELRWEAAHVVRRLVALGQGQILRDLLALAAAGSATPFASARLFFYVEDARQWLVLALARAALDHPATLAPFADALLPFARRCYPHVVIRHYAARAIIALADAQTIALEADLRAELEGVNLSSFPIREDDQYQAAVSPYDSKGRDRGFSFDHDMAKGMMDNLARVFGITLAEVSDVAADVIQTDWGIEANGHWDREPRRNHSSFRFGSRHDAKVDRLNQYLTYHATQAAAAKLLEIHPVYRYRGELRDEFADWMAYRTLTRADGRWVADQRDPVPLFKLLPAEEAVFWPWSVTRADFGQVVGADQPYLAVWGDWTEERDRMEQHVVVRSSLVSSSTAGALLMAAQTANVAYDVYLSPEHEDDVVDAPPFVLKAWVSNLHRDVKVDGKDPWAAGIGYPPPSPAQVVRDRLRLSSRDEGRSWVVKGGRDPLFIAQTWAKPHPRHEEYSPPHGDRLQINRRRLAPVLKTLGLDMILQVLVSRRVRESSYGRSAERDMIEYPNAYFITYLFRQDGTVETFF